MSVRHQHARQAKTYITKMINDKAVTFFATDSYITDIAKVRYYANKAQKNNISVDTDTKYITVNTDGTLKQVKS